MGLEVVRRKGRKFVLVPLDDYRRMGGAIGATKDAVEFARSSIGRDLRKRRLAAGLSQVEVARRARIRVETLCRLEAGRGNPTVSTVRKILKALSESE